MITWKRTLRTPSSERFLALRDGFEIAAVDIHYLSQGTATGTVILLQTVTWNDEAIQTLLASLDEDFLPDVDINAGTLTYTVVIGEIVGNYEATQKADDKEKQMKMGSSGRLASGS